jgi:hypothetical protein
LADFFAAVGATRSEGSAVRFLFVIRDFKAADLRIGIGAGTALTCFVFAVGRIVLRVAFFFAETVCFGEGATAFFFLEVFFDFIAAFQVKSRWHLGRVEVTAVCWEWQRYFGFCTSPCA